MSDRSPNIHVVTTESLSQNSAVRRRPTTTPAELGLGESPREIRPEDPAPAHVRAKLAAEEPTVDIRPTDLVAGLAKPHRRLAKAVRALPADPPDDDLHALRIHGKRLRYAAELAQTSAKKKQAVRIKALIKATKNFQTVLG